MSLHQPWYYKRPWTCRWCGNVMHEHSLEYAKGKRREFCSSRCLHDFKNFLERMFGRAKLKAVINHKNKILDAWVYLLPFEMIERRPIKPISQHISTLLSATNNAEPLHTVKIRRKVPEIRLLVKNS